jgi:rhodanese-related sulfurtransferase
MFLRKISGLFAIGGIASLAIIFVQARGTGLQKLSSLLAGSVDPPLSVFDYQVIDLADALGIFYSKSGVFIDIRDPIYYDHNHIRGAVNIFFDGSPAAFAQKVRQLGLAGKTLVFYCGDFRCGLALNAADVVARLKIYQVKVYAPGFSEWSTRRLPTSSPLQND